jgi:hypothetical protein
MGINIPSDPSTNPLLISTVHAGINQVKSLKPSFLQDAKGASTTINTCIPHIGTTNYTINVIIYTFKPNTLTNNVCTTISDLS